MKADGHAFWARLLSQEKHWRTLRSPGSDFWIGFQESWVTADAPDSPLHYIGTPDGVVDLRDGQLLNHSPSYGVRGLTGGSYRPEELQQLEEAFTRRFTSVLSYENGQAFLDLLGLALTRTAPNRRGWVAVLGESGTGKGGMLTVIKHVLGEYALTLPRKWVQGKSGGDDIDTMAADVIQIKPAVLLVDEAAMSGVDAQVLFSLTGGTEYTGLPPPPGRETPGPLPAWQTGPHRQVRGGGTQTPQREGHHTLTTGGIMTTMEDTNVAVHYAPGDRPLCGNDSWTLVITDDPDQVKGCHDCLELVAEDLQDHNDYPRPLPPLPAGGQRHRWRGMAASGAETLPSLRQEGLVDKGLRESRSHRHRAKKA